MACLKLASATLLETVKKGRRVYGGIYETKRGTKIYLAYRFRWEMFRSGEACISNAVRLGTATWALDESTLIQIRAKGIVFVGVKVRDDDQSVYVTRLEHFYNRDIAKVLNYTGKGRGGSLQRHLPRQYFLHKPGKIRL